MSLVFSPKPPLCALDGRRRLPLLRFRCRLHRPNTSRSFAVRSSLDQRPTILSGSPEVEEQQPRRRCSPILESALLPPNAEGLSVSEWRSVPDIWKSTAEKYGDRVAVVDPYHDPPSQLTYNQLEQEILDFSEGLREIGFLPDEKVALFADNSSRWLVADQGIMTTGAINVVRGTKSSDQELFQIYEHSESIALVVDNPEFFNRIAESFFPRADIRVIVLLWGEKSLLKESYSPKYERNIPIYEYKEIIVLGRKCRQALISSDSKGQNYVCEIINPDDIATLMYTSGTSGTPKGVMLTHRNLLHQIKNLWDVVPAVAGDRFLSMLPPWHAYERACEYFIFTYGIEQVYTNVKYLKEDLKRYLPHYLISVPLVYETLYSSIQKQISSASAARKLVALTFIKISMLYMEAKRVYEVLGTVGHPLDHTEIMIFDIETGKILPDGSKGIVKIRGPQVMKGYYKNPSATSEAIDKEGWFSTGDIGWIAPKHSVGRNRKCGGMVVLEGRAKDTIVLSTGENVEPSELEEAAMRSSLIQQIIVVGQDQRRLGALIFPNQDEVLTVAKKLSILNGDDIELSKEKMMSLLYNELRIWTAGCSFQIGPILIVDEPSTIDNGLMTPTMKIRRDKVAERYKEQIANLYK